MWDQYEQICNAAALEKEGVQIERKIDDDFSEKLKVWLHQNEQRDYDEKPNTQSFVDRILAKVNKILAF